MIRQIIHIDEEKCNGCGICADACHEGAIDIVDGNARMPATKVRSTLWTGRQSLSGNISVMVSGTACRTARQGRSRSKSGKHRNTMNQL